MNSIQSTSLCQSAGASCRTCLRFTELEGEMLCYRDGKIIRLKPAFTPAPPSPLTCDAWQAGKLHL
ncbi:hypothetical protein [Shewanella sp. NFH-SH190041]|uniref:hypothetical protein n=1 Tax=Shewanella sp. NFH-SH190041 TaxID=2950245 RepID=UPI0021C3C1FF|nr:hypothetical protein [Shewanella sp. NFH-SH190041]